MDTQTAKDQAWLAEEFPGAMAERDATIEELEANGTMDRVKKGQWPVMEALEAKGFRWTSTLSGGVMMLTKKPNHYTTFMAEVDLDGLVNGESLEDFLKGL